jgi:SAM-dependent methyltransferase
MAETSEKCPACDNEGRSLHGEKNGCQIYRCHSCGTLYSERSQLSYDGYYDESNLTVPDFINHRLDEVFQHLQVYRKVNRILDVGCGAGSLLQAARRAGWNAEGLEISQSAADYVRSLGFEVFQGDLSSAPYPDNHFDVVTASELIEHVADPLTMLEQIERIIRPGGLLWATTPNALSFSSRMLGVNWSTVCPPEHLQLFSPNGVRKLIERAGFQRVQVKSRGCNPFEIWHGIKGRGKKTLESNGSQADVASPARDAGTGDYDAFNRVSSSYHLNETMLRNPLTRSIKAAANAALGLMGLGDTIRIHAEK